MEVEKTRDELPPYNVYGADGDVTAELIYVNQGMPEDYKELERLNLSVKGRIVIARYGGGWRGLKPKLAHEHGAVGCLIYSDPRDDGYGAGDTYPRGGYRPRDGVQRGSVQDLTLVQRRPAHAGLGLDAGDQASRRERSQDDLENPGAADFLRPMPNLCSPRSAGRWRRPRGAEPCRSPTTLGQAPRRSISRCFPIGIRSRFTTSSQEFAVPQEPDHWIIRGNHHDAWVFGAADPFSGHVAMMAEAKAIGRLVKEGWRPKRTLIYASWDGEEPGLPVRPNGSRPTPLNSKRRRFCIPTPI